VPSVPTGPVNYVAARDPDSRDCVRPPPPRLQDFAVPARRASCSTVLDDPDRFASEPVVETRGEQLVRVKRDERDPLRRASASAPAMSARARRALK